MGCVKQKTLYQESIPIEKQGWAIHKPLSFRFTVIDTTKKYQWLVGMHHDHAYPYYNVFLQGTLQRLTQETLSILEKELVLFDAVSGKVRGKGSMGYFYYEDTLGSAFRLPDIGLYTLSLTHTMRLDTIEGVHRVGIRLIEVK